MRRVHIIAEMACSHEGSVELAKKIIDAAGASGADSIQFQIWQADELAVIKHPQYKTLTNIELSKDAWTELAAHVRKQYPSMEIIACVYGAGSVDFCMKLGVDGFKIHSADLSNPLFLKHVASTKKRVDLSVGGSTLFEIETAVELVKNQGSALWLMYGYQRFPTPIDAVNLDYMMKLANLFELPVGYQDHSDGGSEAAFWLPAAALGMGVDVLEKHITHDRSFKGIDHEAALDPQDFIRFTSMIRQLEAARGKSVPAPLSPEEIEYRRYAKKSIVAARNLKSGTKLCENDLAFLRTDSLGIPPDQADSILGKTLTGDLDFQDLLSLDALS